MTKSSRQKNVSARGLQCSKTMFPLAIQILPFQNGPRASNNNAGGSCQTNSSDSQNADLPKSRLQESCIKYDIDMELTLKLAPRSMHQLIGIGAALCAWLAFHPEDLPRLKLFEVLANLPEALTFCIHSIPHIPKAFAMRALSLIHVLLLSCFSAPTIGSRKWCNRTFWMWAQRFFTYPFFNLNV